MATKEVLAEQCQRTMLQAQAPRMPAIISAHLQLQATRGGQCCLCINGAVSVAFA